MIKFFLFFSLFTHAHSSLAQTAAAQVAHGKMVLIDTLLAQNIKKDNLSSGGGSIGGVGGGDSVDRRRLAAWFYGSSPIQVCYELNKRFGVTESKITQELNKSFSIWSDYFEEKEINSVHEKKINTNFKLLGRCKGGEDLVFYFGTGPIQQNLLDLKSYQSLSNPVAYANKTHVSEDYMWSKGYIRFVESFSYSMEDSFYPDWSHQNHFSQILIHEIGHTLGFTHIPQTIMTGTIVKEILIENKQYKKIDGQKELLTCKDCELNYEIIDSKDLNLFDSKSKITFIDQKIELSTGRNYEVVTPITLIKKEEASPLISVFKSEDYKIVSNHIYFFKYKNLDFTLVKEEFSLTVYKDGIAIATFERIH